MTDPTTPPPDAPTPPPITLANIPRDVVIATLAGAQGGLAVLEGQMGAIRERIGNLNVTGTLDPKRMPEVRVRQAELGSIMQGLVNMQRQLAGRVEAIARARPELFPEAQPPPADPHAETKLEVPDVG